MQLNGWVDSSPFNFSFFNSSILCRQQTLETFNINMFVVKKTKHDNSTRQYNQILA